MNEILTILDPFLPILVMALLVLFIIMVLQYARLSSQIKQLKKKYVGLTRGVDGTNFDEILTRVAEEADNNAIVLADHQEMMKSINRRLNANLNRVSIIHYNAFDFTYGELSFSMAVLDELGTGFIFTNIHNRDDARCYCKRVEGGQSKHPLSEEEKEVLERALNTVPTYSRAKA